MWIISCVQMTSVFPIRPMQFTTTNSMHRSSVNYHRGVKKNVPTKARVEHFAIFGKLVLAITSRILRILMKHINKICSLESKLFLITICSIGILNILEVTAKTIFSILEKCSTLPLTGCSSASVLTFGSLKFSFFTSSSARQPTGAHSRYSGRSMSLQKIN